MIPFHLGLAIALLVIFGILYILLATEINSIDIVNNLILFIFTVVFAIITIYKMYNIVLIENILPNIYIEDYVLLKNENEKIIELNLINPDTKFISLQINIDVDDIPRLIKNKNYLRVIESNSIWFEKPSKEYTLLFSDQNE